MNDREFYPLPDEFRQNTEKVEAAEEERKKKKKRRYGSKSTLRFLSVFVAATMIIMPMTTGTGIGTLGNNSSENNTSENTEYLSKTVKKGTYASGNCYVHFDDKKGWFFNGECFIPLRWNSEKQTYAAAGSYPVAGGELTAQYFSSEAGGRIAISRKGLMMLDPFSQQQKTFKQSKQNFNVSYINSYMASGMDISGSWRLSHRNEVSYDIAHVSLIEMGESYAIIHVTDTVHPDTDKEFVMRYTVNNGVITFTGDGPIEYEITTEERTVRLLYQDVLEGIVYVTESGIFITLNLFTPVVFTRAAD